MATSSFFKLFLLDKEKIKKAKKKNIQKNTARLQEGIAKIHYFKPKERK